MSVNTSLRVVVSCVTFETVRVTEPIIKHYRADRAYLIHMADQKPYRDFLEAVTDELDKNHVEHREVHCRVFEFSPVLKELLVILRKEREEGNRVYINLGAGSTVFGAAGMVACMMEGGEPFYVGAKKHTIGWKNFYKKGKPVGIVKEIQDPMELPTFPLAPPDERLVRGLRIWIQRQKEHKSLSDKAMVEALERAGLMSNVHRGEGEDRTVNQNAVMYYQRKFKRVWVKKDWLDQEGRKYSLNEKGKMMVDIFYPEDV